MLGADMNARYWRFLAGRYSKRDRYLKIFLALMSSGAVAGWGFWKQIPLVWQLLSSLAVTTAIIMPFLNYQDRISKISDIAGKWLQIQVDYENLWWHNEYSLESVNSLLIHYGDIKRREVQVNNMEHTLPIDKKLLEKCYKQVMASRELE